MGAPAERAGGQELTRAGKLGLHQERVLKVGGSSGAATMQGGKSQSLATASCGALMPSRAPNQGVGLVFGCAELRHRVLIEQVYRVRWDTAGQDMQARLELRAARHRACQAG